MVSTSDSNEFRACRPLSYMHSSPVKPKLLGLVLLILSLQSIRIEWPLQEEEGSGRWNAC